MLIKKFLKKKINKLNYYNYKFLVKFINKEGNIYFKKKYKKLKFFKNRIKKNIKILRFLSILPYTFKHFYKN